MATPKPTPTRMLELRKGKLYDKQRDRGELEPKPDDELVPKMPVRFTRQQKKWWRYYAAILDNYGILTVANAPMLEMLSTLWVVYLELEEKLRDDVTDDKALAKYMKILPPLQKILDSLAMHSTGLAKIGSLRLKAQKQKDEIEDLFD